MPEQNRGDCKTCSRHYGYGYGYDYGYFGYISVRAAATFAAPRYCPAWTEQGTRLTVQPGDFYLILTVSDRVARTECTGSRDVVRRVCGDRGPMRGSITGAFQALSSLWLPWFAPVARHGHVLSGHVISGFASGSVRGLSDRSEWFQCWLALMGEFRMSVVTSHHMTYSNLLLVSFRM